MWESTQCFIHVRICRRLRQVAKQQNPKYNIYQLLSTYMKCELHPVVEMVSFVKPNPLKSRVHPVVEMVSFVNQNDWRHASIQLLQWLVYETKPTEDAPIQLLKWLVLWNQNHWRHASIQLLKWLVLWNQNHWRHASQHSSGLTTRMFNFTLLKKVTVKGRVLILMYQLKEEMPKYFLTERYRFCQYLI
jgi:hypothetical protein